jgi:hypothetical protein
MKLAFLYNCFDLEFLKENLQHHLEMFDMAIILWQEKSNLGNYLKDVFILEELANLPKGYIIIEEFKPNLYHTAQENEFAKRRRLIEIARMHEATHYLMIDPDEFYEQEHINAMKFLSDDHLSFVSDLECYFKLPTLKLASPGDRTQIVGITNINCDIILNYN